MLYLASSSPRRSQLLRLGGWTFKVIPAHIDEKLLSGEKPREYVIRLAREKSRAVGASLEAGIVLAADTIVVDDLDGEETILGKPVTPQDAERMLRRLRGHRHRVLTGLAVLDVSRDSLASDCCETQVPIRDYSDAEMFDYIASGDPFDKAGAYAIQHPGFHPVESVDGCYANVMGLPLCQVVLMLERVGLPPAEGYATICQLELNATCTIQEQIVAGGKDKRYKVADQL
jgi:septum formation protein